MSARRLDLLLAFPALVALLLTVGCRSSEPGTPPRDWQKHPAVFSMTGATEIDVLGDLHGDLEVTTRVLSSSGLITTSAPRHWTGGSRVLIVTGDVIDKGSAALQIIDLLISLEAEAEAAGGRVIVTLGNHEAEFVADPASDKVADFRGELMGVLGLDPTAVARGETPYGAWLLSRPVAALVDGWFFSHGGNTNGMTLAEIEQAFRERFDGNGAPDFAHSFLTGSNSLLEASTWWPAAGATTTIDFNLAVLPATHLVFGHEPGVIDFPGEPEGSRAMGEMATRFGGRIFLTDVGMSYKVGYSTGALLRITTNPDGATAIYPDGTSKTLWP